MTEERKLSLILFVLILGGCAESPRTMEPRIEPAAVLTELGRYIRAANPSQRIAVHSHTYCGFPEDCDSVGRLSLWSTTEITGALHELGAQLVQGDLRSALSRETTDLEVAFGRIHLVAKDSGDVIVRYERAGGAKITRILMSRSGAAWKVDQERTISTSTIGTVNVH
jgi:hypothetical protein